MIHESNGHPTQYVVEAYAHRKQQLEARRQQIPGSFILWEPEGVPLPSGRRTPPVHALWRPRTAEPTLERAVAEPEPLLERVVHQPEPLLERTAGEPLRKQIVNKPQTIQVAEQLEPIQVVEVPTSPAEETPRRRRISPRHLPKTTKHKGITRVDHAPKRMFGYLARVSWKGEQHGKFFSDKKYGDRLAALDAALRWRNETERKLGKPRTNETVPNPRPSNTGIRGIRKTLNDGRPVYEATWFENGRIRRTNFSIRRHGEEGALRLAIAARDAADARRDTARA